jgi:hypothetical protein
MIVTLEVDMVVDDGMTAPEVRDMVRRALMKYFEGASFADVAGVMLIKHT